MKHNYIVAALLLALSVACSPKIYSTKTDSHTKDSVRVEIRERIDTVPVIITIEKEVEHIVTRDTMSHLENSYAVSDAMVTDGFLHHTLETKPQTIRKPVPVVVHDTLYFESQNQKIDNVNTIEIERKLTKWQSFEMVCGDILLCLLVIMLLYIIGKLIIRK